MRGIVTVTFLAMVFAALAGTVAAQSPYEMRAYVGPTGGPTEMFNMAGIRATYVCPYCGHSSYDDGTGTPICSNPYDDSDHPSNLAMVKATAADRVLTTSQHVVAAGDPHDYQYTDTSGNTVRRIVMGKVFHPEDNGDTTRSTLHLRTCDMAEADGTSGAGDKIDGNTHMRFFIMPPGVTRPCATVSGMTETEGDGNGGIIIGINPYRVDDGDEWYIEYRTWRTWLIFFWVYHAEVRMYSQLYGEDFDAEHVVIQGTTTYISNSGAVTVQATHGGFTLDQQYRYRFTVNSNARLFPSHDEMPALVEASLATVTPRGCWLESSSGAITTDSNVAETGAPAVATSALEIQPNEVGIGTAAVQYADDSPVGGGVLWGGLGLLSYCCYDGWEWQYDWENEVSNLDVGNGTANFAARQYVEYLGETRYVSSRVVVPPSDNLWAHSDDYGDTEAAELTDTYPRIILGSVLDPTVPNPIVYGEYGPGMRTPTRQFNLYNRFQDNSVEVTSPRRCEFCGRIETDPAVTECSNHATPIALPTSEMVGHYYAGHDIWSDMAVSGTVERVDNTGTVTSYAMRHILPKSACKFGYEISASLFDSHEYDRNVYQVYTHEDDADSSNAQSVHVQIPPHQPPSVPPAAGATFRNYLDDDEGYRGGMITWADEERLHETLSDESKAALTAGWDVFYRVPDTGRLLPTADDANNSECMQHEFCDVCGAEYLTGTGPCPFCDKALTTPAWNADEREAYMERYLCCEEYDIAGLQVSVLRKPSMRATAPAVQLGRVQPGVGSSRPDVNVQNIVGNRAFPADTSLEAIVPVVNDGNITSAVRLGNVTNRDAASADVALPHYSRLEVAPYDYSRGRIAQATPITRLTMKTYSPYANAPAASWDFPSWNIASAPAFGVGGVAQLGSLQAGYPGVGGEYSEHPIPLGQPAGTYLGETLCFLDTNGDGALSFEIGGPGGSSTNTFNTQFDPLVDYPLEPVYDTVTGDVRVFGSRLPQNDYYSSDASPTAIVAANNRVQVIWAGSRPTAAGTGSLPVPCAPGDNTSAIPSSSDPVNLLYATAAYNAPPADDPLYRSYSWPLSGSELVDPYNLSNDSGSGTVSSSPWALGSDTARWAFWHRRLQHPGGTESTLRYDTSTASDWAWSGSGAGEWIYSTGLPKENLRSFIDGEGQHWLFWHTGSAGQQHLMYRWDYTLGTTDDNEGVVPVANRASRQWRSDVFPAIDPRDETRLVNIRKPSQSPFVYAKDPSVFLDPGNDVNLFFSGYARSEQEADICWTRFDITGMDGHNSGVPNYGKLAFGRTSYLDGPYVYTSDLAWTQMPEELQANGLRQVFTSRHLDWVCHHASDDDNFAVTPHIPDPTAANLTPGDANFVWNNSSLVDPVFCLSLIYDNPSDGERPRAATFLLTWQAGEYLRSRGVYRVYPRLYPLGGATMPQPPGIPEGTGYLLEDPSVSGRQVMMEINPATGTISFSSPLFSVDNPADPLAVFNDGMSLGGGLNLVDVAVFGSYHPYVYRVTRNGADDDCPSAFYISGVDPSRLTVFWRRRYPVSSAPHFGRSGFMHKSYATSVQVAKPPIDSISTLENAYSGAAITHSSGAAELTAGIVRLTDAYVGATVRVIYETSDGATHSEYHQVPGWCAERPIPIRTGGAEGRLAVQPEIYSASGMNTVRYWLFWTSLGRIFDLRLLNASGLGSTPAAGSRVAGEPIILQSSDVYSAVVSPATGSVARERQTATVSFDPT